MEEETEWSLLAAEALLSCPLAALTVCRALFTQLGGRVDEVAHRAVLHTGPLLVKEITSTTRGTVQCLRSEAGLAGDITAVTLSVSSIHILALHTADSGALAVHRQVPVRAGIAVLRQRPVAGLAGAVTGFAAPAVWFAVGAIRTLLYTRSIT